MSSNVPTILDGYKFDYESKGGAKIYVKNEKRTANWSDLKKLDGFFFGSVSHQREKPVSNFYSLKRFYGYFPVTGFLAGFLEFIAGVNNAYYRTFIGKDTVYKYEKVVNTKETLKKRAITVLKFTPGQSAALLFMAIAQCIRGIITFCQLGALFIPFDWVANHLIKA